MRWLMSVMSGLMLAAGLVLVCAPPASAQTALEASVRRVEELNAALGAVAEQRGQALFVVPGLVFTEHRMRVAETAVKNKLPTMLSRKEHVEAGGLVSYGTNYTDMYRRAATYVDKMLLVPSVAIVASYVGFLRTASVKASSPRA